MAGEVNLGNQSFVVPKNGIVYSIAIQNWPFDRIENQLTVTLLAQQNANSDIPTISTNANSETTNLRWLNLQVSETSLYATFQQTGIVDDTTTYVKYACVNNSAYEVSVTLPHFWEYSEFAVVYAIAQENVSSEAESSRPWYKSIVFIAVLSSVGGALLIAGVVAFVLLRRRRQNFAAVKEVEMK